MKTKLNLSLIALIIGASTSFFSCKNETENIALLANPSSTNFKQLRENALKDITTNKSFKAEDGLDYTTSKGTRIRIMPNCLKDQANNSVTGDVNLSFIEMHDRGNMLVTNKPLMGKDNSGNLLPLITGGQYHIAVDKAGQSLKSGCVFFIDMPASLTGEIDSDMKLWRGNIDTSGELAWDEIKPDNANGFGKEAGMNINTEMSTYSIWANEFGWTNVDKFYNDTRPKTQIKVTVPSTYNATNAAVYLAYEGEKNVLARLDTYDSVEKFFSEHYGFLPIGLKVHIIFTTESNGSYVYAIKSVTIAANSIINIDSNELQVTTKSNLVNTIKNLN